MIKIVLSKEEQLNRGIPVYQLGQESLSMGFYESCFIKKTGNNGSFREKDLTILMQVLLI